MCRVGSFFEGELLWQSTGVGWCLLLCRTGWGPLCRGQPVWKSCAGKVLGEILGWGHALDWWRIIEVASASTGLAKWKKRKKIYIFLPVLLCLEKFPPDHCPSVTHPKGSQWIFLYDFSTFQAAASVLGLGISEFVPVSFKRSLSSHRSLAFPDVRLPGFENQVLLWELIFLVQLLWACWPNTRLEPLAP